MLLCIISITIVTDIVCSLVETKMIVPQKNMMNYGDLRQVKQMFSGSWVGGEPDCLVYILYIQLCI